MIFRRKQEEHEKEAEEVEYVETPAIIRVKFRPHSNTYWRVAADVEPPQDLVERLLYPVDEEEEKEAKEAIAEWLREEWGGGEWKIETVVGKRIDRSKTIKIKDEHVRYGVNKWVVWVKGTQSNRWYKADIDFDHPPSVAEVIDAVGGGGHIKVVAYDDKNRQVESWVHKVDAPPPDWVLQREDSLEKSLMEALRKRQEMELKRTVEAIAGVEPEVKKKDKFDEVLEEIEKLATDQKIKLIEEFLSKLRKEEEKTGLADILFTEPYKVKMEATRLLIEKLAQQGRVDEAKELLKEIPDGTSALIHLITAGANLANAFAMTLAGASGGLDKFTQAREEVSKKIEKETKQKEKEEEIEKVEEKAQPMSGKEEEIALDVVEDELGWEISFEEGGEDEATRLEQLEETAD